MYRVLGFFAVLFCFVSLAQATALNVGEPAPDFTGTDIFTGKPVALHDLKGQVVVLEWNNFQCPFVKKFYSVGTMQAMQGRGRKKGATWITINSSAEGKEGYLATAADAKSALTERKAQPSYYLLDHDGMIGHLYGAKSTPQMFVIDKNGVLAYNGAPDNRPSADPADIPGATNYVMQALDDLQNNRKVRTPTTQAYGCFVKY